MGKRDSRRRRQRSQARQRSAYQTRHEAWSQHVTCAVLTPAQLADKKAAEGLYLLGVMGYAGRFRDRPGDPVADFKRDANRLLEAHLLDRRARYGERLVVVSGATNAGVLQLVYGLCADHGITAAGVTADAALRYKLAVMDFVVPFGARFGDESEVFVAAADEFLVLGGGDQSMREAEMAAAVGKQVTAIRGFGGAADEMTAERVPTITAVDRESVTT